MAAEDGIYIDHGQALSFAQEMLDRTKAIQGIVDSLKGELAPIAVNWEGQDKDVYFQRVQPTWDAEVGALSTILASHAETLSNVSDNYKQTVTQNAQGFEEIQF